MYNHPHLKIVCEQKSKCKEPLILHNRLCGKSHLELLFNV